MLKIAVIIGSTRPNRVGGRVARWAHETASHRRDAEFELIDLLDYDLPLYDEPKPPAAGPHTKAHTIRWAEKIATFDGYLFVTPEYNHSTSGALKNALDFLYSEWADKPAGFVGYGGVGGVRAVEHLRGIMGQLNMADVRAQVALMLWRDFDKEGVFMPTERHEASLGKVLDELIAWGEALKSMREARASGS